MKVGHSDISPLPQFQWTNQDFWKTKCRTTAAAKDDTTEVSQSLPCSRIQHASCLLGNHVYLFGGKDRYMPLKDLWRLDLENGRWESIVFKDTRVPHLQGHTMVSYRSQVFIFGGSFGESPDDTPLWIYSPDLNHVRKYASESLHSCPVGRREHTAVVYKNSMYIYGGFLNSSGSTDELWAFNLEEEEWSSLPRLKDGKRHGHVSVVHHNAMWVHGGVRGFDCLSDLWMYRFELSTWTKIKGIGRSPSLSHHTAHVVNDYIVVVGGSRKSTLSSSVWIYGFDNNTWRQVDMDQSHLFVPVFLHTTLLINPQNILVNTKDQSSRSTPHLKSHSAENVTASVRPWTSPNPKGDQSTSFHSPSSFDHQDVNVLTVHSDHTHIPLTDKNNNSEENLFSFKESHFESSCSEMIEMTDFNCNAEKSVDRLFQSLEESPIKSSSTDMPSLRPAPLENCHDDLPLLERFCSIGSDVDLGENNAVITISDENVSDSCLSGAINHFNVHSSFEYSNPAFISVISPDSSSNVDSLNVNSSYVNPKDVLCSPHSKDAVPFVNLQPFSNIADIDNCSKPNSKYVVNDSDHSLLEGSLLYEDSLAAFANVDSEETKVFNEIYCSNLQSCQSLNDLIVEDIESWDSENGKLTDLRLALPSTLFVKSSSLKDISSYDLSLDDEKSFHTSHPFCINSPRKKRSNSCSSLAVTFNKSDSNSHSFSSMKEDGIGKNLNSTTSTEKSGKYMKHQTSQSRRNGFRLDGRRSGSQSNLQKMITLKKSMATQTTESLSSLSCNDKPHQTAGLEEEEQSCCIKKDTSPSAVCESSKSDDNSLLSHLSSCHYLLLVLGGQMETPTFIKTPISIWTCKIF